MAVNILRDSTREYTPDYSGAIKKKNLAAAMNDVANLIRGGTQVYEAYQQGEAREAKKYGEEFENKYGEQIKRDIMQQTADYEKQFGDLTPEKYQEIYSGVQEKYGSMIDNERYAQIWEQGMTQSREQGLTSLLAASIKKEASEDLSRVKSSNLSSLQQELTRFVVGAKEKGTDISSREFERAFRAKGSELMKRFAPGKDTWASARAEFSQGAQDIINKGVLANIKAGREQRTKEKMQDADSIKLNYMNRMKQLGSIGEAFTDDYSKEVISALEKKFDRNLTPLEKEEIKRNTLMDGKTANLLGLAEANPEYVSNILASSDTFKNFLGSDLTDALLKKYARGELKKLSRQRAELEVQAKMTSPDNKKAQKEIQAKIDDIDEQISAVSSEENQQKVLEDARQGFVSSIEKSLNKDYSSRILNSLRSVQQAQLEQASLNMEVYNPQAIFEQSNFAQQAKRLEKGSELRWRNGNMSMFGGDVEKISFGPDGFPVFDDTMSEEDKKYWEDVNKDYQGYWDNISITSQVAESDFKTRADVLNEFNELTRLPLRDEKGNSDKWIGASIRFLHNMSKAPLTEEERGNMKNIVSSMALTNDDYIQSLRSALAGPNTAIYVKNENRSTILGRTEMGDERNIPAVNILGTPSRSSFDSKMEQTQAQFQMVAVGMANEGATIQDIVLARQEMFKKSVNEWYADRYVVDLAALDAKLERKEPATAEIDGVVYEYKGRDSFNRPVWRDSRVMNTNLDASRLTKMLKFGEWNE